MRTVDDLSVNYATKEMSKMLTERMKNNSPLTNNINSKPLSRRKKLSKSDSIAMKDSRTRHDGSKLGRILASLSLVNDRNENINTDTDLCKKKSKRRERTLVSNRKLVHGKETCYERENYFSTIEPIAIQQTPGKNEEVDAISSELPLKSSSSMVLFPSLAVNNSAKNIPQQAISRNARIDRFTSMMTPSPIRSNGYSFPSVVRISSPTYPSPLGESMSSPSQQFPELKHDISGIRGLTTDQRIELILLNLKKEAIVDRQIESTLEALSIEKNALGRRIGTAEKRAESRCKDYDKINIHLEKGDEVLEMQDNVLRRTHKLIKRMN